MFLFFSMFKQVEAAQRSILMVHWSFAQSTRRTKATIGKELNPLIRHFHHVTQFSGAKFKMELEK